jgi:glutathione S-transferase
MSFIVRGIPGSPYVRSPLIALEEKGVPYEFAALAMGGHRAPEWREFQPFGKMPAFEHDGFRFYETQAFLRYLDRVVPEPALTPADVRRAARMDQLLNIVDCYVAPRVSGGMTFGRMVAPRFGMPVDEAAIAAAIPDAKVAIDEIAHLLGEQIWLTGDTISLADLHMISHLAFVPHYPEGEQLLAPHANLRAWIARMEARPSMAATSWERLLEAAEPVAA